MMRKILLLFVIPFIFTLQTACSSSDSKDKENPEQSDAIEQDLLENATTLEGGEVPAEGGEELAADEGAGLEDLDSLEDDELIASDGEFALDEGTQPAEGGEAAADPMAGDDFASEDFASEDPLEDLTMAEEPPATQPLGTGEEALTEEPRTEFNDQQTTAMETEPAPEPEYSQFSETEAGMVGLGEVEKAWVPVKKIASEPFKKAGVLVNAVYIARGGDTLESVSQKIYGTEAKSSELLNINTTLGRGVKVGDKIYYNSPQRPNDSSQLLTFYEDAGLAPEEYITQSGDNIRELSKKLLGHDRSWMEVYATNMDVESKGEIREGLKLRYWASTTDFSVTPPSQPEPEPHMAANEPPPEPEPEEMNDLPPPPDTTVAMNDMPPPPPGSNNNMNGSSDLPPPPPPQNAAPDLPPPPDLGAQGTVGSPSLPPPPKMPTRNKLKTKEKKNDKKGALSGIDGLSDDTLVLGIGALLILIGLALFIIKKKKANRQTEIDFHTATHTQID